MITLHHLNNSRSQRVLWLLEELGTPYQIECHQRDATTQLAPASLKAVHPLGKSPVIVDSDHALTLAESGAIIEYLISRYGDYNWAVDESAAEYWQYRFWLHFSEGSVMPPLVMRLVMNRIKTAPMPFFVKPIARNIATKVLNNFVEPNIRSQLAFIEQHLQAHTWFCGARITGADIQMSFPLEAQVSNGLDANEFPAIHRFVHQCQARPAYQAALQKAPGYAYVCAPTP
ncbi:glutathione S-transferase [Simiduia sp. 21SJ11W-1]|uniref:glutathione S-transferase n=1 Tax=Simiduia sp. 21SJ11W-1 TaxID=2909669 RepID=UPI00209E1344|nr:glutathione S-transferase [Simiduia sp. 21SJ11W-1]UTA47274.1 glutathione S-transferase [Simiduia sp. 21SJ11W-1]